MTSASRFLTGAVGLAGGEACGHATELRHCDAWLVTRLQPMLAELLGPGTSSGASR